MVIERKSFSEQIADALRQEILNGVLPPGSKLSPEGELAQRFGTNRNTLREAIRSLESLNLVQVRQGDGVTVRDFRKVGELSLLPYYLGEAADAEEALTALAEVMFLRRMILGEAAAMAARRANPEETKLLEDRLQTIRASMNDAKTLIAADVDYYRQMVALAQSLVFVWIFNTFAQVYKTLITYVENLWVTPEGYLQDMEDLTAAIIAHDESKARQVMEQHFAKSDSMLIGKPAVNSVAEEMAPGWGGQKK